MAISDHSDQMGFAQGDMDPCLVNAYAPDSAKYSSIWNKMVKAADQYNEPGRFTALIGYEWTSLARCGVNPDRTIVLGENS